jgi:hypothetical protein
MAVIISIPDEKFTKTASGTIKIVYIAAALVEKGRVGVEIGYFFSSSQKSDDFRNKTDSLFVE